MKNQVLRINENKETINNNIQYELTIEKQKNEIISLRYELQKTQLEKASRLEDSLFSPKLYQHYMKIAQYISKSELIPSSYKNKPEDIFIAWAMGYQLGFPVEQSLQDISVINGRPCLWGDGLLSLVLSHKECEYITEDPIEENGKIIGYKCKVKRKGHEPHEKKFTLQDAQLAGLLSRNTWKTYPTRMLQMRARSLALRDKFSDALRGIRISEIEDEDTKMITASESDIDKKVFENQTDKLKTLLSSACTLPINNEKEANEISESVINLLDINYKSEIDESWMNEQKTEDIEREIMIKKIESLIKEKNFDEERKNKVLDYYFVNEISEMSDQSLRNCLQQLEKIK